MTDIANRESRIEDLGPSLLDKVERMNERERQAVIDRLELERLRPVPAPPRRDRQVWL
jgi:hypothetical protein